MADLSNLSDDELFAIAGIDQGPSSDQNSWFEDFQRGLPIAAEALRSGLARMPSATARGAAGLTEAAGNLLPDWMGAERMRDRGVGARMSADAWDANVRSQTDPQALAAADTVAGFAGMVPQLISGPVALPMLTNTAFGNTYADARERGRTPNESLLAGSVDAGLTAATMSMPLGILQGGRGPLAKTLGSGSAMSLMTMPMVAQQAIKDRLTTQQPIDSASYLDRVNPFSDAGQSEYLGNFATGALLPLIPQFHGVSAPKPQIETPAPVSEPNPINHLESGIKPDPKAVQMGIDNARRFTAAKEATQKRADDTRAFMEARAARTKEVKAERFDPIQQVAENKPSTNSILEIGSGKSLEVAKRNSLVVRPDLMQFRQGTDKKTGVSESNKIEGKEWDPIKGGVITVWEPTPETAKKLDIEPGKLVVVNGHHRVEYGDRVNNDTYAIHRLKEADGISYEDARILGAELNIVDNKGDFRDKLVFFKGLTEKYGKEIAQQRAKDLGIKDRIAPNVAFNGSDYLLDSARNGKISEQQAGTIVVYAKGSEKAQAAGVEAAKENPDISTKELAAKTSSVAAEDLFFGGDQADMFAQDPPELKAYLRQRRADYIKEQLTAADETVSHLARAVKDYEGAKRQLKDPGEISDLIDRYGQAKATQEEWHNWTDHRDIRDVIQQREVQWRKDYAQNPKLTPDQPQQEMFADPTKTGEEGALKIGQISGDIYDRIKGTFENVGLASRNEVQKLPESERFVGGRMDVQLLPRSMVSTFRKVFTSPRVWAQKFPELESIYRIGQDRLKLEAQEAFKMNDILQPYWKLSKQERAPLDEFMAKDREATAKAIKAGEKPPPLTTQDLQKQGFSDSQIEAYKAVRKSMNHALNRLQFIFEHKGRAITDAKAKTEYMKNVQTFINLMRRQRYVPFSRYGEGFEVASTFSNGDTAYREFFDTRAEAIAAKKRLESESGNLVVARERPRMDPEAWDDLPFNMLGIKKHFDMAKWTKISDTGVPMLSFTKHLIEASLVPGYEKNLARSIADYSLGLSRYVAREFYAPEMQRELEGINPETTPEARVLVKKYIKDLDKSSPIVSRVMNVSNFMNLAASPVSAAVNATQSFTTTYPELLRHANPKVAAEILGSSFLDAGNYLFKGGKGLSPELVGGLKLALEQGNLESQALNELRRVRQDSQLSGKFEKLNETLLTPFTAVEKMNRVVAFISGFKVATQQGIGGIERIKFAEDFVDTTQFVTNRGNLPEIARNPVGRVLLQYKTSYLGNYLRFLRNNLNKEGAKTFATSVGVASMLAGYGAIPFMKELVKVAESFGFDVTGSLRELLGKNFSDVVVSGLPAKLAGIDLSASTGIEILPEFDMSKTSSLVRAFGGPTVDYAVTRPMKALEILRGAPTWDSPQTTMALEQVLPRFLRNPLMAARTAASGKLMDSQGNQLLPNPDIPGDKPPTSYEIFAMAIGANPTRKATATREKRRIMQLEDRGANAGKYLKDRLANAVRNKNPQQIRAVLNEIAQALGEAKKPSERFDMRAQDLKKRINPSPYKNVPKRLLPEAAQIIRQERGL